MAVALRSKPVGWAKDFYGSQLGKKAVMAVSGIVLFGYVFFHMLGNLKIYLGREAMNSYAEWLRELLEPFLPRTVFLWVLRSVLIAAFVLHVVASGQLTIQNRRARRTSYRKRSDYLAATYASRTMRWTGVIVGLFVVYHLMHLTWGTAHPDYVRGDVYRNFVIGFSSWPVSAAYIAANLALGLHLYHGLWSMFQSLGLSNPRFNALRSRFAGLFAFVVTAGNVSFPVAVLSGLVR